MMTYQEELGTEIEVDEAIRMNFPYVVTIAGLTSDHLINLVEHFGIVSTKRIENYPRMRYYQCNERWCVYSVDWKTTIYFANKEDALLAKMMS